MNSGGLIDWNTGLVAAMVLYKKPPINIKQEAIGRMTDSSQTQPNHYIFVPAISDSYAKCNWGHCAVVSPSVCPSVFYCTPRRF